MRNIIRHHYIGGKNLDDDLLQYLYETGDENPDEEVLNESVESEASEASSYARNLMSHLILVSICRDRNSLNHWLGEIVGHLQSFRDAVGIKNN